MRRRTGLAMLAVLLVAGCSGGNGGAAPIGASTTAARAGDGTSAVVTASIVTTPATSTTSAPPTTTSPPTTVTTTTIVTTTTAAAAPLSDEELARAVALRDADVAGGGVTFTLIGFGDVVQGQVTLDVCNARFASEQRRAARYQQVGRDAAGTFVVNNENVVYADAAGAEQAMDEIRSAVAGCPTGFQPPAVQGMPAQRFVYEPLDEAELGAAAADHIALAVRAEDRAGASNTFVLVYQRRGRVLVGVYGRDLPSVKPHVEQAAQHLAALAEADVATGPI